MQEVRIFWRTRERLLWRQFDDRPFRLLDVGAGNDSPLRFKTVFGNCEYHGIDRNLCYHLSAESLQCADRFYVLDLTECNFGEIPDDYFDALICSHVLEHLFNAERVLKALVRKVKPGGFVYIEWPSQRSLFLPSMRGTLNFFDDEGHVRLLSRHEIVTCLSEAGCETLRVGVCRNIWRCVAFPLILFKNRWVRGYFEGSDFWELLGFADFIWARKVT